MKSFLLLFLLAENPNIRTFKSPIRACFLNSQEYGYNFTQHMSAVKKLRCHSLASIREKEKMIIIIIIILRRMKL